MISCCFGVCRSFARLFCEVDFVDCTVGSGRYVKKNICKAICRKPISQHPGLGDSLVFVLMVRVSCLHVLKEAPRHLQEPCLVALELMKFGVLNCICFLFEICRQPISQHPGLGDSLYYEVGQSLGCIGNSDLVNAAM